MADTDPTDPYHFAEYRFEIFCYLWSGSDPIVSGLSDWTERWELKEKRGVETGMMKIKEKYERINK